MPRLPACNIRALKFDAVSSGTEISLPPGGGFYDEIADEIFNLREQREKCTVDTAARDAQIARINELQDFIKQQPAHLDAFDEALVKRWLERIIIWDDHFTVELKSGLKIDIEG